MQLKQLDLPGGGLLTVYLRDCVETMPQAMERPLVLVVPGGGYSHLSAREGDPVALQFAAVHDAGKPLLCQHLHPSCCTFLLVFESF